ncbi:MAG: hypothetical protein AB8F95_16055 [Bacteroidia bacterium]
MGKFSEMCSAFNGARDEFDAFKKATVEASEYLWKNMMEYFEAPQERVTLYRIGPQGGFEVANPPVEEVLVLSQDGFWNFGLGITLYCHPSTFPRDTVLLHLRIRRALDKMIQVQLAGTQQMFTINPENDADYHLFYEHVYTTIIESYRTGLERLVKEDTVNRIGFDLSEIATAPQAR